MATASRRTSETALSPDRFPSTRCQFNLAPPRRFLYPAILLLLADEPRHGYRLIEPLVALGFGPVERPAVYRALADLEADGLIRSWFEPPTAGSTRHVHAITPAGQEALESWMSVIGERACLDLVLEKYWYCNAHRLAGVDGDDKSSAAATASSDEAEEASGCSPAPASRRHRFEVIQDRSVLVVEARSDIGPIAFGSSGVRGEVEADLLDGLVLVDAAPRAWLEVSVADLSSGNSLYDAEFLARADARRHPHVLIELQQASRMGDGNRYQLEGDVTFHGSTRRLGGAVTAALLDEQTMIVTGEQTFDVREFEMTLPTMPLLKIYPDVRVHLHVEARRAKLRAGAVGAILAFAVGYVLGARAGREGLDEVAESARAVRDSEELAALVSAVRAYLSHALQEASERVAPQAQRPLSGADLLDRLRGSQPPADTTTRQA